MINEWLRNEELNRLAEQKNIKFLDFPIAKSCSCRLREKNVIAIDMQTIKNQKDFNVIVARELGHFYTNNFYSIYSSLLTICQSNLYSEIWAIEILLPFEKLKQLLNANYTLSEISDYFQVTTDFTNFAIKYYLLKNKNFYEEA